MRRSGCQEACWASQAGAVDLDDIVRRGELDGAWPLPVTDPFTTRQAAAVGLRPHDLRRLARHAVIRPVVKGVWVTSTVRDSTHLRCQALSLVVPHDCVVVDRHAGWLLGAEMVLAPNEHVHLQPISIFRPSGNGRLRRELADSGERNLRADDITEVDGIRVTTPIRTAWDLGRVRWPDRAVAGLDAMLRLEAFTHEELLDGIERFRRMRWVTTLRAIAPLADGRSQSPGESVLRLRWIEAGLAAPLPQLEVWRDGRLLGVLDIANEALRYAAEYDGVEWHSSDEQRAHDRLRRRGIADEDWFVDVFVAANVFGPQQDAIQRLRAGAAHARRAYGPAAS